jgi:3-oxoacyl-[acyl-carrier protein] reductase
MNIKGCRALITGGSKGIGFAIAEAMKKMGANIAITSRNYRSLSEAAKKIDAVPIVSDIRSEAECKRAVIKAVNALGGLDVLINNAAVSHNSPVESLEVKPFHNVWQTNVVGPMVMTREVIPLFKKQQHGTIINIASTAALRGYENATAYVASKFALRGMTQCWQAELRRYNIRVILINPSEVQTNFGKKSKPSRLNPKKLHPEDIAHAVVSCLLMECRGFVPEMTIYATNPW